MTITPAAVIGPAAVPNAAAAIYTSPTNTTTVITRAVLTNVSAAGAKVTLWVVRDGDSRANSNIVMGATASGQTISAGPSDPTIVNALAGLVLAAGDAIHGLSDTADALNLIASGWTQ